MRRLDQKGLSALLIPFILASLLFVAAGGFGVWAFVSRQDYKNNTDQKVTAAVQVAVKQAQDAKDAEFAQTEKLPTKTYSGPATYGSIHIEYPKTWSAYVDESNSSDSGAPVNGYWYPDFVPGIQSGASYALRVEVTQTAYSQELATFDSLTKAGKVKVSAFQAPKVQNVIGSRIDGEIAPNKQGSLVLIPLRDKTLKIWTESSQFRSDFDTTILPNLSFAP